MKMTTRVITVFLVSLLFLSACGGGKNANDPAPVAGSQIITLHIRNISGLSVDRVTNLSFAGVSVLDSQGNALTSKELSIGQSELKLYTSSLVNAQDLKILVKANGFVDMGATIQLDKDQEEYQSNIFLIPEQAGKVKEGIYTEINTNLTGINSAGVTEKELTLTLQESTTTPQIKVIIPEGTKLTGVDGQAVVPTSSIIVRFDPSEENVLDAYPGGLNVLADVSGTMEQIDFKSAAFASIILKDETGKKVKNFDKDITIAMQFKKGTTNGSGNVVVLGDSIPIWSYDEDKGTWVFEKDGVVADLDVTDDLYDVVYQTNHLTYFNLDWNTDNVCNANITVKDGGNVLQNNILKVEVKLKDYNITKSFIYRGDGVIDLLLIPDSRDWELNFYHPLTNELIDTVSSQLSLCGDSTIDVDLPSIGNVPVTHTEIQVNLSCPGGALIPGVAAATPLPIDVYITDKHRFLIEYGMAINEPFDFRTYEDGVLNIYDLPRTYFDQPLEVSVFPVGDNADLIRLALQNSTNQFTVKIGRDKDVNNIELVLPEDYCNSGGTVESKIDATVSCPSGNIPNTQSPIAPFVGIATAVKSSGNTGVLGTVLGVFNNGSVSLNLLNNTEYNLNLSHTDPSIFQHIINNEQSLINAGEDKTFSFILTDEYCSGNIEDPTYTYTDNGSTVTETPHINASGSIDLNDYIYPSISTQLRYLEYSKSQFFPNQPETILAEVEDVLVEGSNISSLKNNGSEKTDLTILVDRIKIENFEKDDNGEFIKGRDSFIGRLYSPGQIFYETHIVGSSENQFNGISITYESDFNFICRIEEKMSDFSYQTSQQTYSYSGEIVKIKCTTSGIFTIINNTDSTAETVPINMTNFTYFKKGVGEIVDINENCIADGELLPNNTPGCTVNDYSRRFFVESEPAL